MADQPTTPSGSRWEPDGTDNPGGAASTETPAGAEPPHAAASYDTAHVEDPDAAVPLDEPAADGRRAQLRGRAVLAGAATALALGGGIAGFVIGHSAAGNDTNDFRQSGFTGQPGGQPPGFGHDRDDDGEDHGDDDGDHAFGQPPQGPTDGGSSSNSSSSGAGTTGNPT